ncbi:MAG: DUF4065 domain-containing protein [Candidatus Uhrbacteria bacterium]|nr:DUF4065 domain-containing protein [Candidatus Uhrbacteria bacterium]
MSPTLTTEQYILYILNRLQPEKSDLRMLNKIAFLVEFAYLYFKEKEISKAKYAAIDNGPVIDGYKLILDGMEKKGLIKLDGYKVRIVDSKEIDVSKELDDFASPLIAKYSQMNSNELRALTHSMDSYLITTKNEKIMGKRIDKDLAALETIFEPEEAGISPEVDLPLVDFRKLVPYEL